jgi:hypothetical protein
MNKRPQHPLFHIAREYMRLFPAAQRFGRGSCERQLQAVLEESGWDAEELLRRIHIWSKTRHTLSPRQLLKPLPKATIEEEKAPEARRLPVNVQVTDEQRERALWIYQPYLDEDI